MIHTAAVSVDVAATDAATEATLVEATAVVAAAALLAAPAPEPAPAPRPPALPPRNPPLPARAFKGLADAATAREATRSEVENFMVGPAEKTEGKAVYAVEGM